MVRLLFETSVPARTLGELERSVSPGRLPPGIVGRVELDPRSAGCEGPARGGDQDWTPCWISLETDDPTPLFGDTVRRVRRTVVEAARGGGVELFAIPATAQIGDEYLRLKDVLDVLDRVG